MLNQFSRTQLLLGKESIERLQNARVAVFGIADTRKRVRGIESFIENVRRLGVVTAFDEELWGLLIDSVTVYSKENVRVEFRK